MEITKNKIHGLGYGFSIDFKTHTLGYCFLFVNHTHLAKVSKLLSSRIISLRFFKSIVWYGFFLLFFGFLNIFHQNELKS
jgi:hypothetical protein